MQSDIEDLIRMNERINEAENVGNLTQLGEYVATELAFRRRDGSIVNRETFLKPKPGKRVIQLESVLVWTNRAVVACVVTDSGVVTHNVRLFVKVDSKWRLLGWANDACSEEDGSSRESGS